MFSEPTKFNLIWDLGRNVGILWFGGINYVMRFMRKNRNSDILATSRQPHAQISAPHKLPDDDKQPIISNFAESK